MAGEDFVAVMVHDSPLNHMTEIWLPVGSVTMIGSGADGDSVFTGDDMHLPQSATRI